MQTNPKLTATMPPEIVSEKFPERVYYFNFATKDFWLTCLSRLLIIFCSCFLVRMHDFVVSIGGTSVDTGYLTSVASICAGLTAIASDFVLRKLSFRKLRLVSSFVTICGLLLTVPQHSIGFTLYLSVIAIFAGSACCLAVETNYLLCIINEKFRSQAIGIYMLFGTFALGIGALLGDFIFLLSETPSRRFWNLAIFAAVAMMASIICILVSKPITPEASPFKKISITKKNTVWSIAIVYCTVFSGSILILSSNFVTVLVANFDDVSVSPYYIAFSAALIICRYVMAQLRRSPEPTIVLRLALTLLFVFALTLPFAGSFIGLVAAGLTCGLACGLIAPIVIEQLSQIVRQSLPVVGAGTALFFFDVGKFFGGITWGYLFNAVDVLYVSVLVGIGSFAGIFLLQKANKNGIIINHDFF